MLKHACGEQRPAAMLAIKKSIGVAPVVNLMEHTSCIPPPSGNKAAHSGFEMQRERHQKSKNRSISDPIKGHVSTKNFKKKEKIS